MALVKGPQGKEQEPQLPFSRTEETCLEKEAISCHSPRAGNPSALAGWDFKGSG